MEKNVEIITLSIWESLIRKCDYNPLLRQQPQRREDMTFISMLTVVRNDTNQMESYVGHTEGEFKSRYYCHTSSFKLSKYRNATELSKYIWQLKESKVK